MWVNLINLLKQQIIVKARIFTYTRLRHSMEIKKSLSQTPSLPLIVKTGGFTKNRLQKHDSKTGFVADSITAIYRKGLKLY